MVAYSFKERFIHKIRTGIKFQTIRGIRIGRGRHARPGEAVQLYYGMRTSQCRQIGAAVCRDVRGITLDFDRLRVEIFDPSAKILFETRPARDLFAIADGFESWTDLVEFWRSERSERTRRNSSAKLDRFDGVLITWHKFEDLWASARKAA